MSVKGQEQGIAHGTVKGYKQHRYRDVPTCEPCLKAVRDYNALRAAERTGKPIERSDAQAAWYGGQFQSKAARTEPRPAKKPALPAPPITRSSGTVLGQELAVGDVIVFLGKHYIVDRFEPYDGSLLGELGEGTRTAYSGEWGMTIGPKAAIRILPRPGGTKHTPKEQA